VALARVVVPLAGANYELWGMRSIKRALSQLVSSSAQGLGPALASLGDRFGFQRVGHRRIREQLVTRAAGDRGGAAAPAGLDARDRRGGSGLAPSAVNDRGGPVPSLRMAAYWLLTGGLAALASTA
jgi:hypothetical protein